MTRSLLRRVGRFTCGALTLAAGLLITGTGSLRADDLPSAESILDRHVEATGGEDAYLKLTTRKKVGTFEADIAGHMLKAKLEVYAQAPDKSYLRLEGTPLTMVRVCDGKQAWEWNPGHAHAPGEQGDGSELREQTRFLEGSQKEQTIDQARFHGIAKWRETYEQVKTVGVEEVGGKPAYEVRVTPTGGAAFSQFYDKKTGRLVKYVRTLDVEGDTGMRVEVLVENYREIDGVWLPMTLRQNIESATFGQGTQTWNYTTIEHNVTIPPSLFELPDELKKSKKDK